MSSSPAKPIVFISYEGSELDLADFVRKMVTKFSKDKLEPFVARRDIGPGDDPLKRMLEDKLKKASAGIPICSLQSKESSWVWWESAAIWATGHKVYPLSTNISLGQFGAPLSLVSQGQSCFDPAEFSLTIQTVCQQLGVSQGNFQLTAAEIAELNTLKNKHLTATPSAAINLHFDVIQQSQSLHEYSLILEITNTTNQAFTNIFAELYFPEQYLDRTDFSTQGITVTRPPDPSGYLTVTFDYSALREPAKRQFAKDLLPGRTIRLCGQSGLLSLRYWMDRTRWQQRTNYQVKWRVYINGGAPIEGSKDLNLLQNF